MHWHPLQAEGNKQKLPNALISTVIPYAGGQVEFAAINMRADAHILLYSPSSVLTDLASLPHA